MTTTPTLDFYIPVATFNDGPSVNFAADDYTWSRDRFTTKVRCYRKLGIARSIRTKALKSRANEGIEQVRILHVHINLIEGSSTTEWLE